MSVVPLESEDVAWFRDHLTGARTAASRPAARIGMGEHRAGEVALAMSEAVSNLVKHAVAGAIVLRVVRTGQHAGIEFLALDHGPGMADVGAAMRDGRSTAGTLGIGLGMVARLADTFDLHSVPGHGTVMLARFWPRETRPRRPGTGGAPPQCVVGGVTRPISGAPARGDAPPACGDGRAAHRDDTEASTPRPTSRDAAAGARVPAPDRTVPAPALDVGRAVLVMLCDGLGHGPLAETAARAAIRAFHTGGTRPDEIVREIHRALAGTRGAAVAVARIEPDRGRVLFCGVGDTAAAIVTPTTKTDLPSVPGIAGHRMRTPHATAHPLPPGSALVMHSDGLTRRWNPETLHGVLHHSPAVIAGHLLRGAGKYHDDASVVVTTGPW